MTDAHGRRLVAFDFDGTLADTWPWFALVLDDVADRYGFRRPTATERIDMRHMEARAIIAALGIPIWQAPRILAHVRQRMQDAAPDIPVFAGIACAIDQLAQGGVVLAVVSSNTEGNVRRVLGPTLSDRFAAFECGIDLFGKAAKLRRLLARFGCPPGNAILVGDELRDIDAARAAGMAAGAVGWGYNHPDALRARLPDAFFETPADLANGIDRTLSDRRRSKGDLRVI